MGVLSSYSNYGAALAGKAAAWTSGKTFERLAEESLFEPMGMERTSFREPRPARQDLPAPMAPALAADLSRGFSWTGVGLRAEPFEYISQVAPAGSASSTADDMARYMLTLLGGGLSGETRVWGRGDEPGPRPTPQADPARDQRLAARLHHLCASRGPFRLWP